MFHALITKPRCREVAVQGPQRSSKAEAIKDSEILGKAYQLEGETGVKRVASKLERKRWSPAELASASESSLEGLLAADPRQAATASAPKPEKLIPPGEGWVRFSDQMLWEPRSEVYFAQAGSEAGKYLMKEKSSGAFQEVESPHLGFEAPITVRAGGASFLRKGSKLERTVLLPEIPKIARLALKFPLSFVDTPASAFAIFQGVRTAEAADWCAKNFHTKLLPLLASKIHNWEAKELQELLERVLREMDGELLKSSFAYSGCNAVVALLLGSRLVISGVGQIRVALLCDDGSARDLLAGNSDYLIGSEKERVEEAKGVIHEGLLYRSADGLTLNDAHRILLAKSPFEVLQIEPGGPSDEKQVRTAYRKLALRVHPDKRSEGEDLESFNKAFARLDAAKDVLEAMLSADGDACRELHRIFRAEVHTREGAAELLAVDKTVSTDTELVVEEAEKASKALIRKLAKMEAAVNAEYHQAIAICKEAVEVLRRPNSPEALPRAEALLRIGLTTSRAMGVRDMRYPSQIVLMKPESMSWAVPLDKPCRIALLVGAAAKLPNKTLTEDTPKLKRRPKASALQWCAKADAAAPSVGAACLAFEAKRGLPGSSDGPAAKKQKTVVGQQAGSVFVRHILFRHQQLKIADPAARRDGVAKGPGEAEAAALSALEQLLASPSAFNKLCRELSDCASAEQPGNMVGHLGWVVKGEQEQALEEAAFCLDPNEFSDVVTTSRGIHILQRLG